MSLESPLSPFRSPAAEAEYLTAYDAVLARWPVPVTGVDIESPAGTTRVLVCGPPEGEPLVLLPGHGATATVWFATASRLAAEYRVHAVDPLGDAGRSVAHGTPIRTAADLTGWLDHLLTALGVARAHLCGHSYGGWTALTYAVHAPQRVRSLSLLDPTRCFAGFRPGYLLRAVPMMLRPTADRVWGFLAWETGGRALDTEWLRLFVLGATQFRAARVVPDCPPRADRLRGLPVPVQVLLAGQSRAHDVRAVAAAATERLPHVTVDVLAGATHHSLPIEPAGELAGRLTGFLAAQR